MKKKLGCMFYPVVIFFVLGIFSMVVIAFTDNVEDEQFTIADTDTYAIDYFMNTENALFLELTNETEDIILMELVDTTSGGQNLSLKSVSATNSISEPYDAEFIKLSTLLENESSEQNMQRMLLLERTALALPMRTDTGVAFNLGTSGNELMNGLISHEVSGTIIVYVYDKQTGEATEIGRHKFTKPAGVDGQI